MSHSRTRKARRCARDWAELAQPRHLAGEPQERTSSLDQADHRLPAGMTIVGLKENQRINPMQSKTWSAVDVGRDSGRVSNPSLMDYKAPTSQDAPFEITPLIVEAQEPDGPFGAKGAGEIGMNAVPAASANAVTAATGCRFNQLPLTPERVLRGILASESSDAL